MNLIMQFSFLVEICNKLCFADIAVDRIKRSEENCLPSFSFLSSCDQSSYCNRVLVSCSTHVIDEFFSCVRNHLVIISLGETKISPECPWIARKNFNHPSSSLQISKIVLKASKIKAIERILVCEFLFSLNVKSFFQYWEYMMSTCITPSSSRSYWSWCRTIFVTHLEMRVSLELFRHLRHPGIVSQILFSLGIFFFT